MGQYKKIRPYLMVEMAMTGKKILTQSRKATKKIKTHIL